MQCVAILIKENARHALTIHNFLYTAIAENLLVKVDHVQFKKRIFPLLTRRHTREKTNRSGDKKKKNIMTQKKGQREEEEERGERKVGINDHFFFYYIVHKGVEEA